MISVRQKREINKSIEDSRYISGYHVESRGKSSELTVCKRRNGKIKDVGSFYNNHNHTYTFTALKNMTLNELKACGLIANYISEHAFKK